MSKINEIESLNEFIFPELVQDELYEEKIATPSPQTQIQGRVGAIKRNKQRRDVGYLSGGLNKEN